MQGSYRREILVESNSMINIQGKLQVSAKSTPFSQELGEMSRGGGWDQAQIKKLERIVKTSAICE